MFWNSLHSIYQFNESVEGVHNVT